MSEKSPIEWTDATWNPVRGCVKVSAGCKHCYAETFAERFSGVPGHPYEQGFDLRLVPEKLIEPLKWKDPRRVFVNSMSDLFQDGVPDQFITDVFGIMALAHWHTFQVLTKRPQRMLDYLAAGDHGIMRQFMLLQQNGGISTRHVFRALDIKRRDNIEWQWPLPNVCLGVSVENQQAADERVPLLLQTPAPVRFISAEPLLGPVSFRWAKWDDWTNGHGDRRQTINEYDGLRRLDWVIVGGESGPKARPCDVSWIRSIVQQCAAAGVPVFVKQLGARVYGPDIHSAIMRDRKGGDMSEWPADLRVRQFPEGGTR